MQEAVCTLHTLPTTPLRDMYGDGVVTLLHSRCIYMYYGLTVAYILLQEVYALVPPDI